MEMGPPYAAQQELASFHSISKGYMGECVWARRAGARRPPLAASSGPAPTPALVRRCGFRGGYVEVVNMDAAVQQQMQKLMSVRLCPPLPGQVLLHVAVSPPEPSDPSFAQFQTVTRRGCGGAAGAVSGQGVGEGAAPPGPAWPDGPSVRRRGRRCWPSWRPRPNSRSRSSTRLLASAVTRCRAPCTPSRACSCPRALCSALRCGVDGRGEARGGEGRGWGARF